MRLDTLDNLQLLRLGAVGQLSAEELEAELRRRSDDERAARLNSTHLDLSTMTIGDCNDLARMGRITLEQAATAIREKFDNAGVLWKGPAE